MPFCKDCGTLYAKSLNVCPKCNANDILNAIEETNDAAVKNDRGYIIRRWATICILLPALIGIIYFIISLIKNLNS